MHLLADTDQSDADPQHILDCGLTADFLHTKSCGCRVPTNTDPIHSVSLAF